jgi:hypothetical protein
MRRLVIHKQWWLDTIPEMEKTNAFVVMQSEDVKPNYRDDAPPYAQLSYMKAEKLTSLAVTTLKMHGTYGGLHRYLRSLR